MRTVLLISVENCPAFAREALAGIRPMPDYVALSRATGAEIIDRTVARESLPPRLHSLALRLGADAPQAFLAFRRARDFDQFVCDSEGIGLPLAALLRATRRSHPVFFIGHRMTTRSKGLLWHGARVRPQVGGVFCYARSQAEYLHHLGLPASRVHRMPFHADHRFFRPEPVQPERLIASVGQERRDYATLVSAAASLDCRVQILAASPWSRSRNNHGGVPVPGNVTFLKARPCAACGKPHPDQGLRELYARAAIVAVPVEATDFQAGTTSLLEGMAMGRPVVATGNPGLRELFREGEAGLWVPPGDVKAMARALSYLLANPREAAEMGRRGRAMIEREMSLDHWVERIRRAVTGSEAMPEAA